ncbi:MAG: alpha/beta hydrolase [Chloroflexota bacterium]
MPGIKVNGADLYYEDTGKGKPIVFIHGYVSDIEDWRHQINYFSSKYRCLALDQRGRGKGTPPKNPDEYTFDLFVDDVYQWLKALKVERFVLDGHSLGGMISQGFTLAHPEMVEALVLTDTSSGSTSVSAEQMAYRKVLNEIAFNIGTVAAFDYDYANDPATTARYTKHPETWDRMREKTRTTSPEGYVYVRMGLQNRPVYTERLSEIKCPTILFCGTDDVGLVEPMKLMASKLKGSELIWLQNAGHGAMYDKPGEYNQALAKFLQKIKY